MSYVDEVIELVIAKNPAQPEFSSYSHRSKRRRVQKERFIREINNTGKNYHVPCSLGR